MIVLALQRRSDNVSHPMRQTLHPSRCGRTTGLLMSNSNRELGLDRKISRRDFLDGMGTAIVGGLLGAEPLEAQPLHPYPPARTGLRGAHAGSFEVLHRLRDGGDWNSAQAPHASGEVYDLIVVGAGISGLAAAHAFRKAWPRASVLLLDNHDDVGGHAKRNELGSNATFRIGYGGSQSISSPASYSKEARTLIAELGVKVEDYPRYAHGQLYRSLGLAPAFFFAKETYGADHLVTHRDRLEHDADFISRAPLSDVARRDLVRLATEQFDPYPGEPEATKRARLARQSYRSFLLDIWKVDASLIPLFDTRPHGLYGVGIDAVPAQDANGLGYPGFQGMGLGPGAGPGQNLDSIRSPAASHYFFHFPDGNATLARLLVRRLIPGAVPGRTVSSAITARVDYDGLDCPAERVRIRLNSPVVRVRHLGISKAPGVEVTYMQGKRLRTVQARRVILACW